MAFSHIHRNTDVDQVEKQILYSRSCATSCEISILKLAKYTALRFKYTLSLDLSQCDVYGVVMIYNDIHRMHTLHVYSGYTSGCVVSGGS